MMRHHLSRASLAEQRRDAERARSEHANSSVARTLRLVAQWEAAGLSRRAARILADQGVNDLAELRRNRTWPTAPGCGPKMLMEISDFLRRTGDG